MSLSGCFAQANHLMSPLTALDRNNSIYDSGAYAGLRPLRVWFLHEHPIVVDIIHDVGRLLDHFSENLRIHERYWQRFV